MKNTYTVHCYSNHEQKKSAEANPTFFTRYWHTVSGKIDLEIIDQRKQSKSMILLFSEISHYFDKIHARFRLKYDCC